MSSRKRLTDLLGRKVKALIDGHQLPGRHTVTWNGTDDSGRRVSSGTYFVRLETEDYTATKKMVVVR